MEMSSPSSSSALSSSALPMSYQRLNLTSDHLMTSETTSQFKQLFKPFANPLVSTSTSVTPLSDIAYKINLPMTRTPIYDHNWTTATTTSADRPAIIMSVVEGRGRAKGAVGLAVIDLNHPMLVLSQFNDTSNYESLRIKCEIFTPIVILIPKTLFKEENHLLDILRQHMSNAFIRPIDRKYFNENMGQELIDNLRCDDCSTINIELKSKYYCLSSTAALINYIETVEHIIYSPKTLKVVFEGSEETMAIDPTTTRLLELIVNMNDPKSDQSLFGVINKTKTRSGYRLLRSNILQPTTNLSLIHRRHEMIEEIISSQTLFQSLEAILSQLSAIEIERVISGLIQTSKKESVKAAERKIETILVLKHIISLIEPLIKTLSQTDSTVFNEYTALLTDSRFDLILKAINEVIIDSVKYSKGGLNMRLEKCHAIKSGFNSLLDIARNAYSELVDDISYIISEYEDKYSLAGAIKSVYTSNRGFHLVMKKKNTVFSLPKDFIRVNVNKNSITFTTQELINKNNRINAVVDEMYLMSDFLMTNLIESIRQHIGCLYNLSEVIAKVDLVFSFAYQCSIGCYTRPVFDGYLAIKRGRHPILEQMINRTPVPNDTFMSEDKNFMFITGPNMSGKTSHLKQVAILQVMAQIGLYIPAEFASFRVCDRLFSRIGNNDEIETNSSTFMVEMREMSFILHNITDQSLVIIDELGRGTSVEEGLGLCWALCERLLQTKAFTLFVTHFIELTKLENHFFNVSNYHFGVEHLTIDHQNSDSYTFTHILESGVTEEVLYGLRLANQTSLDTNILGEAQVIAQELETILNEPIIMGGMDETKRAKYELSSILKTLVSDGRLPPQHMLQQLKAQFVGQINKSSDSEEDFTLV